MSGPKIDSVEVERRRREELERQRQLRIERIRRTTEEYEQLLAKMKRESRLTGNECMCELQSIAGIEEMAIVEHEAWAALEEYRQSVRALMLIPLPTEAEDIVRLTVEIAQKTKQAQQTYETTMQPVRERVKQYLLETGRLASLESASQVFAEIVQSDDVVHIQNVNFTALTTAIEMRSDSDSVLIAQATQTIEDITSMVDAMPLSPEDGRQLILIAQQLYEASLGGATELVAAVPQARIAITSVRQRVSAFEEAYRTYMAECLIYLDILYDGLVPDEERPAARNSFRSVEAVLTEIQKLRKMSRLANEQRYIRQQFDDVMRQFGYAISEPIVFDVTHRGEHFLCRAGSRDTAIHVHLSESNQIMMEVVGLGVEDGHPAGLVDGYAVGAADLDAGEILWLCEEQRDFCDQHPRIVAEMERRGVLLEAKVRRPVDRRYSKRIVRYQSSTGKVRDDIAIAQTRRRIAGKIKLREQKG